MYKDPHPPNLIFALLFFSALGMLSLVFSNTKINHKRNLKKADDYFIEMNCVEKNCYTYLLNKKLKPAKEKNVSAEINFIFPDSTNLIVSLKPQNNSAFICSVPEKFCSCIINFNVSGKLVSGRFSAPMQLASKN